MKIKAKYKLSTILILSLGVIGFSIMAFSFLKPMFNHKYIQIIDLGFFLFSVTLVIGSLFYLLKNETIYIENGIFKTVSFGGLLTKEYSLQELKSYTAIRKENKYIKWEDLDLYFRNGKARITSSNLELDKYYKIKDYLTKDKEVNNIKKAKWANRQSMRLGIGFIVVGLLFSLLFVNQDKRGNRPINHESTEQIIGMLKYKPELKLGRSNKKSIEIELSDYPNFKFKLNGPELKAFNVSEFLKNVNQGDNISIKLWKETYNKKIIESEQLTFLDRHIKYHQIEILGINMNEVDYMPQNQVNKYRTEFHTKGNFYGLMAFGLFMIGLGVYLVTISKKAR